ncbi:SDR family NAD(P)-dependent oxidoreductase [Fodinicola feengrottensis]|uniref:Glucose 1-dehydrogenase n=1 Tax=Fodinicola feengrottensis TaxID=435914 RepID=A0ABP4SS23_9ACTN|nr:glucose 1-dehydrogenase [Fodinicola feengrottensis]
MTVLQSFDLTGKRALVTGANRGLGKAFALALAEAGASVAITGRDSARNAAVLKEMTDAGHQAVAITADVTQRADVERTLAEAIDGLGAVDILVNNAGLCFHQAAFDVPDDEFDQIFDLNVRGLWLCSTVFGRHMADRDGGVIVNVGSISGLIVNRPQFQASYNASKAAVHQLTKSLAAEWAPHHIRVNALAPGYVKTEMAPVDRPEFRRMWIEDSAQQRYATPAEIAPSVVYLASDASAFMTGSVLVVDGGYTIF